MTKTTLKEIEILEKTIQHRVRDKSKAVHDNDGVELNKENINRLFSKICGLMVAPQAFQADDRALSASNPMF
jgi:hypothetical protein